MPKRLQGILKLFIPISITWDQSVVAIVFEKRPNDLDVR